MNRGDIKDLEVYTMALEIGNRVWTIVSDLQNFEKNTIGFQLARSADSIAANISEGYGRYYFKENKQFCYFARGSLYETVTWITKILDRDLLKDEEPRRILNDLKILLKKLNAYINYIDKKIENNKQHN